MTPRAALHLLSLLYLAALRTALATGVPRDDLAAGVCAMAVRAGVILDGGAGA